MIDTPTVEPEALVSRPEQTVLFMSRRSGLRLVKVKRRPNRLDNGEIDGEIPGEVVAFREGALVLPRDGEVMLEDGRTKSSAEVIAWLEGHRLNGDVQDGFWRVDPTAPAVSEAEIRALMDAALELDVDKLRTIISQERDGWGRAGLIEPAESALERIGALLAKAAADAAAKDAAPAEDAPPAEEAAPAARPRRAPAAGKE